MSTYSVGDPSAGREGSLAGMVEGSGSGWCDSGGGGWMLLARSSRWWAAGTKLDVILALEMSAMVSVPVQKIGGLFFHPIGRTSGKAIGGSSPGRVGKITPNLGMSSTFSPTRYKPLLRLSLIMWTGPCLGLENKISRRIQSRAWPNCIA
jgi:hypothetical protein